MELNFYVNDITVAHDASAQVYVKFKLTSTEVERSICRHLYTHKKKNANYSLSPTLSLTLDLHIHTHRQHKSSTPLSQLHLQTPPQEPNSTSISPTFSIRQPPPLTPTTLGGQESRRVRQRDQQNEGREGRVRVTEIGDAGGGSQWRAAATVRETEGRRGNRELVVVVSGSCISDRVVLVFIRRGFTAETERTRREREDRWWWRSAAVGDSDRWSLSRPDGLRFCPTYYRRGSGSCSCVTGSVRSESFASETVRVDSANSTQSTESTQQVNSVNSAS
ncbi:uncharacterized protein LOC118482683 [Helianthus annuus]|uniref:uncharacterized protein LOC118482683 n=1 Tax=Helianthus annuus TaxID=4232 RepID=UPI00165311CE|nr:uncharacterized protein LOC118482683 [Helianthus annuus]